jgi:hypothetical protein
MVFIRSILAAISVDQKFGFCFCLVSYMRLLPTTLSQKQPKPNPKLVDLLRNLIDNFILSHPHPIPPNVAPCSGWDKKSAPPIPTQTGKRSKPKNQSDPKRTVGWENYGTVHSLKETRKELLIGTILCHGS